MYLEHFNLHEFPFSLTSDPRFLYLSEDHARVKAYIEYAMQVQDSFLVCTGEIGTGKTTLINDALLQDHKDSIVARIQINHHSSEEFLQQLMLELKLSAVDENRIQKIEKLKQYLFSQFRAGKKVFLIVDEAHNINEDILDDIRYFSDIESDNHKLLGVILVGQPELNTLLGQPKMEYIAQRIRLRCHIKPLKPDFIFSYINHRLKKAGSRDISLFSHECIPIIHQFTGGRIRLINTLCDYALLHCCVENVKRVTIDIIQKAANELRWEVYEKRFGESSDVTRYIMPAVAKGSANIMVKKNGHLVDELKIASDCINIGRQSDNDIPVDDFKVSRYHAQILTQANISYLHDLNSTNGTKIDDKNVTVHRLTSGEEFFIGTYSFLFTQSVMSDIIEVEEKPTNKDITRQMTLAQRDNTRILYKHPYINLVEAESNSV